MLTPTSKVFLPVAGVALFLGAVYKIITADVLGGTLFLMLASVAFLLGVMLSTVRENEVAPVVAAGAPPPGVRAVAVAPVPGGGGWPAAGGVAVGLVLLGLIEHPLFTVAGALLGLVALAGWLARASSESTGRQISLLPVGLPVLGLFTVASLMFFLSRILLAVPKNGSTVIALFTALLIMFGATLAAVRPNISGRTLAAALALGGVLLVGGGIAAAAHGERKVEKKAEEGVGAGGLVQVKAANIAYAEQEITIKGNADVEIRFDNNDRGLQHNIDIAGADASKPIFRGDLVTGVATVTYKFKSPAPGTYNFHCDIHPDQMKGTVKVT